MNIYQKPKYVVEFKSATAEDLMNEINELMSRADISPEAYPALTKLNTLIDNESSIISRAKINNT